VGLGADPKATMRWAEDPNATEAVRGFWRSVAEAEIGEPSEEPAAPEPDPRDEPLTVGHLEPLVERIAEALRGVDARMDALEARAAAPIAEEAAPTEDPEEPAALLERISALEGKLSALEEGRDRGEPSPPVSVHDLFEGLRLKLAEDRREAIERFKASVAQKRGKLDDAETKRREVYQQAEADIRSAFGITEASPDELVAFSEGAVAAEILRELRKHRP